MHRGHQALYNAELVIEDLCNGRQTVGGAGGVGNKRHIAGVLIKVHAAHKHGGIVLGGRTHDNVLGAGVDVALAQLLRQMLAGALADIFGAHGSPGNVLDLHSGEHGEFLAVDNDAAVIVVHLAGELAVHGVILQHIGHVLGAHEGVVDTDNLHILVSQGGAEGQAADAAKAVNTDFGKHNQSSFQNLSTQKAEKNRLRKRFFVKIILSCPAKKGNQHFR